MREDTPASLDADKARLPAIRARLADASRDWSLDLQGSEDRICARVFPGDEPAAVASLTVDCGWQDRDFLIHARDDIECLLRLLAEASRIIRGIRGNLPKCKDYAAECAMKCADPPFMRFIGECHGLERPWTHDRVATRVRGLLAIKKRSELNNDPAAAQRWQTLRRDFEHWRRT